MSAPAANPVRAAFRDRRVALLVATALIGATTWFVLTGGPLDAQLATAQPAATAEAPADADEAVELVDDLEADAIVTTYEVLLERDPFDPVVPRPVTEEAAPAGSPSEVTEAAYDANGDPLPPTDASPDGSEPVGDAVPVGTEEPPPPADGTTPDEPAPGPGAGCAEREGTVVCDGRTISLLRIVAEADGRRVAVLQVGSTIHEVEKGEVFAATFRLRTVGEDRVTVLYGDDEFELEVGDRVLK